MLRLSSCGSPAATLFVVAFAGVLACNGPDTRISGAIPNPGTDGNWRGLASMPAARQEIAAAALNGRIFVVGGFDTSGTPTSSVFVYDVQADRWSSAADLPLATDHPSAAVARGTLFVFGAGDNRTFVYNEATNSWRDVARSRFQHRNTAAVAVINDVIFIAGGTGNDMAGNEAEAYDPVTDTWRVLAPMRVGRNHCAGGAIGGKFYVAGGRPGDAAAVDLEVFDPATNAWSTLPNMPTGRSGIAAAVVNGVLYTFGGEGVGIFDNVEAFNPATNQWSRLGPMRTPRHGIWAAAIGTTVYLPGGATSPGLAATNVNEAFTP
jgi:N-acetylneuraminic acid mutarotase